MPKQLAPGKFSWNEDERYFRDRNGVKVDRRNVRLGLDKYLDSQRDQTERLTERLRDGEITVGDWQLEMEAMIKRSHVAATALAKGGKDQVKAADWGVAGQAIRFEYERLNRFARELEAGREVDGRAIQRAKMYAVAATGTYEAVLRRDDIAANFDMEMRHLHSENPCNQCELYTLPKGEWHPAGTLPGIGEQCSCLSNCRCTFERKRSAEAYARWKARNPKPPKPVKPPKPKPVVIEPPKPLPKPPEPPKARTPKPATAKPVAAPVVRELTPEERLGAALEAQRDANRKWAEDKPPDNEYAKLRKRLPELIPPGPIQERIQKYVVGDEKLKLTLEVGEKYGKIKTELDAEKRKLTQDMLDIVHKQNELVAPYVAKRVAVPPEVREKARALQAELDAKIPLRDSVRDRLNQVTKQAASEVHSMFRVKDSAGIYGSLADNRMKVIKDLDPLDSVTQANANKAIDWLKSMIARGDKSELDLRLGQKEGQRAHYDPRGEHIALAKGQEADVVIHEYAHGMEDRFTTGSYPNRLLDKSKEFLDYRAKGEPELQFNKKWPGYRDNEKGRKDKFEEAMGDERQAYYMGKTYYDATEIFSMGLQAFYNDPVRLAQKDPEIFKLVNGFMDGSLR